MNEDVWIGLLGQAGRTALERLSIVVSIRIFTSAGSRVIWREPAMKTFVMTWSESS